MPLPDLCATDAVTAADTDAVTAANTALPPPVPPPPDLLGYIALQEELGVTLLLHTASLQSQLALRDVEHGVLPVPLVDPGRRKTAWLLCGRRTESVGQ